MLGSQNVLQVCSTLAAVASATTSCKSVINCMFKMNILRIGDAKGTFYYQQPWLLVHPLDGLTVIRTHFIHLKDLTHGKLL